MEIQWDVCKYNLDHQRILEDLLPREFRYQITRFKIDEESTITAETKFTAQFNVNCCTEEATGDFLRELQSITNTTYNIFTGDNRKLQSCIVVGTRKCHHNVNKQMLNEDSAIRKDKQIGKNTKCKSTIKFRLLRTHSHSDDPICPMYPLQITFDYSHNHCIMAASALKFNEVAHETKEQTYFI